MVLMFGSFSSHAKTLGKECSDETFISQSNSSNYRIQKYDKLSFIYNFADTSKNYENIPVFPNGKLKMPQLGETPVEGSSIEELENYIKQVMPNLLDVEVFVFRTPLEITVLGAVNQPGSFSIEGIKTIYGAIGKAGGFSKVANKKKVKLIRQKKDGTRVTHFINFPKKVFQAYEEGTGLDEDLNTLQENDLIFVEKSKIKSSFHFMLHLVNIATVGAITGAITALIVD